jgi:ribosomal protein L24
MRNPQKGNRVEITTGKNAGQIGVVVGIEPNGRVLVQIEGLPYERSYGKEHLEYRGKVEQQLTTGEARRKRMAALVKEGKMCPSYPHACSGECGVKVATGNA